MQTSTHQHKNLSLNRLAFSATLHCLTGCSIGEVLGMIIGMSLGLGNWPTIALSVALAFFFGYSLTLLPLVRNGMTFRVALPLAFASDTISIAVMEVIDNALMMIIPGAMESGPASALFWGSMALSLAIAGLAVFPIVRWLISRGKGHAVVHQQHGRHNQTTSAKTIPDQNAEGTPSDHHHHHHA